MAFPRAPRGKIKGALKLYIRPPVEEDAVTEPEPAPEPGKKDYSAETSFKLPRGFTEVQGLVELVDTQRDFVLGQIQHLRDNMSGCSNCRKSTSEQSLDMADHLVEHVSDTLKRAVGNARLAMLFGQNSDRSLMFQVDYGSKHVVFHVYSSSIEFGLYQGTVLYKEFKSRVVTPGNVDVTLEWLLGERDEIID